SATSHSNFAPASDIFFPSASGDHHLSSHNYNAPPSNSFRFL
ncbi:hypothetical protein CCACVL1_15235, partial [Corchorus capsularis]